jgi:hypothetical protein
MQVYRIIFFFVKPRCIQKLVNSSPPHNSIFNEGKPDSLIFFFFLFLKKRVEKLDSVNPLPYPTAISFLSLEFDTQPT